MLRAFLSRKWGGIRPASLGAGGGLTDSPRQTRSGWLALSIGGIFRVGWTIRAAGTVATTVQVGESAIVV